MERFCRLVTLMLVLGVLSACGTLSRGYPISRLSLDYSGGVLFGHQSAYQAISTDGRYWTAGRANESIDRVAMLRGMIVGIFADQLYWRDESALWHPLSGDATKGIQSIASDGVTMVGMGRGPKVVISKDGKEWRQLAVPGEFAMTVSISTGVLALDHGYILASADSLAMLTDEGDCKVYNLDILRPIGWTAAGKGCVYVNRWWPEPARVYKVAFTSDGLGDVSLFADLDGGIQVNSLTGDYSRNGTQILIGGFCNGEELPCFSIISRRGKGAWVPGRWPKIYTNGKPFEVESTCVGPDGVYASGTNGVIVRTGDGINWQVVFRPRQHFSWTPNPPTRLMNF